ARSPYWCGARLQPGCTARLGPRTVLVRLPQSHPLFRARTQPPAPARLPTQRSQVHREARRPAGGLRCLVGTGSVPDAGGIARSPPKTPQIDESRKGKGLWCDALVGLSREQEGGLGSSQARVKLARE